jgi:peptide deformylase
VARAHRLWHRRTVPALRLVHNCFPVLPPQLQAAVDAMAVLTILRYPDPRLHTVAKPVAAVDERIRRLVDDMLETMYAAEGVGLAATQVDVHERVVVMDTSAKRATSRWC